MSAKVDLPVKITELLQLGTNHPPRNHQILIATGNFQIVQLLIPAGGEIPTYEAEGDIILHCLEGEVSLTASNAWHNLRSGQLIYLERNAPFSIRGIKDSSLLATIIAPKVGENVELIGGQKPAKR